MADDDYQSIHDDQDETINSCSSTECDSAELRSKRTTYLVVVCILFAELCERLTFYGVVANLVLYCRDVLKLDSPLPSTIVLVFQGTCFVTPVIGGWLADTFIGRYNTIYGCSLLYILGTILLTATSCSYPATYGVSMSSKEGFLAVSLILIAVGTGGIKANISPMGADQIQNEGREMVQKFFNWFYWFIQVGSLLAFTVVVYVQQEVSFFYGYMITAVSMVLTTIVLLIGRNNYTLKPPQDSYLTDTLRIIGGGLREKLCCKKSPDGANVSMKDKFSEKMVEDVKTVVRLLPIFVTFILYWTIFGQSLTTFILQGSYMKLIVTDKLSFPAASLNLFEILSLLILIPFIDRVVYPGLHRLGFNSTSLPLRRIGVGLLFAASSVVLAGVIEIKRKDVIKTNGTITQEVFNKSVNASTMSVFYQIPQYMLLGTSEALVSVTGLEFAYSQSPADLRGVMMGLFLAMIGLGYYVASAFFSIVKHASNGHWYPDNLNNGSLEYYMFLLAGLMMVNAAVFLLLAVRYKYADRERQRPEDTLEDCTVRKAEPVNFSVPYAAFR